MQPTQGRPVIVLCLLAVAALAGVPSARAQGELEWRQFNVPGGDTFIRRTSQSVLPVNPHAHIDLLKYRIGTWAPTNPDTDLFAGVFDLSTGRYARFDLVFDGLVSPPGSYGDDACDPLQYGDNPLYAVVEFDVDGNTRTGGELARCQDYFLGNCGRFGFRALGAAGYPDRTAEDLADTERTFDADPQVQYTGADFELLLGGQPVTRIEKRAGDSENAFGPGGQWVLYGRFFSRAHGYEFAPFWSESRSEGAYNPIVPVLFAHAPATNTTTVSLVFPLTNRTQPFDANDENDVSIAEALNGLVHDAFHATGHPEDALIAPWLNRDPNDYLTPADWGIRILAGTCYLTTSLPSDSQKFVWTDYAPRQLPGDLNGDGVVDAADAALFAAYVAAHDGDPLVDADGDAQNGSLTVPGGYPGNFSLYDRNYDGVVDAADAPLTPLQPSDLNDDGNVDGADWVCFEPALAGPQATVPPPDCGLGRFSRADLDADADVDLADLALLQSQLRTGGGPIAETDDLDPTAAVFTRPGPAYLGGPSGLTTFGPDQMRRKWELSCSQGRVEIPADELQWPGSSHRYDAVPWCVTNAGLWATMQWSSGLWLTNDGVWWTWMGTPPEGWITGVFALRDGRLIVFGSSGNIFSVSWSDNGSDWTVAATLGGAPSYIHNFHEAPHGTIIAVTYVGVNYDTPKQIWRSADRGQTWQLAWTGGVNAFKHFHSVVYHPGTQLWIADTGDSAPVFRHTFVSRDDGQSWNEWYESVPGANVSSPTGQVTCYRDVGDPRRVYLGSDGVQRVAWFDLTTWRVGTSMERQFTNRGPEWRIWDLSQIDGLWYATLASVWTGHETPVVLVSADLSRWAVYARLPSQYTTFQTFGYCAGQLNGWLHYIIANDQWSVQHARMPAAHVADVYGVCVSPAKLNLLTPAQSTCDQLDAGWVADNNPDVFEVDSSYLFAGSGALHLVKTGMGDGDVVTLRLSPACRATPNLSYRIHIWVRGRAKLLHVIPTGGQAYDFSFRANSEDGSPAWTEIWTPAVAPKYLGGGHANLPVQIDVEANDVDRTAEMWLGAAEVVVAPAEGEWVPGGTLSAQETFNYEGLTLPPEWTHLFSTVLLSGTDDLGNSSHNYIRTYRGNSDDYVELYFDNADDKFKLSAGGTTLVTSASRWLLGGTRVYFAVRRYADGRFDLSISDGNGVEHISGDALPLPLQGLAGPGCSIRSGNNQGTSVAAQVYLEDVLIKGQALSDEEITARFSNATLRGHGR